MYGINANQLFQNFLFNLNNKIIIKLINYILKIL